MNDNSTGTTRPLARTRGRLLLGAAAVAGLAMMATTAPVVAGNLVTSGDLAKGAVTTPKIGKKAVKSKKLADGAVKTAKIKDGAVTTPKLGDGAVTSSKVAAGSVTRNHLAADLQPLWAVVWGGPSIVRGKGAVSVAHEGIDSQFRVTFDRDISQCGYTATLSQPDSNDPEQIGMANVSSMIGDPKSVLVRTRDHAGVSASRGFTVHVWC
jgi:hypothetical protein